MNKQLNFPLDLDLTRKVYGMNFVEWLVLRERTDKKIERLKKTNRFHLHDGAIKVLTIVRNGVVEMENRALLASLRDESEK